MDRIQLDEQSVFDIARRIESVDARADYVEQICAADPALKERVAELLSLHEQQGSFLESPPEGLPQTRAIGQLTEKSGDEMGPYRLLQQIGEGGFGVVYMAEQTAPIRRKVAIKIIKPGMESQDVIARFEAERQALAMMSHPNIATVLDGGCTPSGRPYFVMELVRGVSITEFCDKKQLSSIDRVRLFMDVCSAIQHAHQKGVIHRDLKPSNVMVTLHDGQPVVKVIDFGVAKAINQQLTEKTYFTNYGQMIGTPQYMSPEQAEMSGLGIDTLSDVYSLGVLLYELLVGMTPLSESELREAGYKELRRMICEEEAAKPSNRLSTTAHDLLIDIANHRGVTPEELADEVKGDLEWIVMKTLEKDRDRRYSTPLDLSRDLERYLGDQPIEARPPTLGYRVSKYVRRHRGAAASSAAVALILLGTSVFSSYMWRIADAERALSVSKSHELAEQKQETELALGKSKAMASELNQQLYRFRIQEASKLVQNHSRSDALEVISQCPDELKGWETRYLEHSLRSRRGPIPASGAPMYPGRSDRFVCISNVGGTGKLETWDANTGERLKQDDVTGMKWLRLATMDPNHELVAVATSSHGLRLVDISKSHQESIEWSVDKAHTKSIDGIAFSPDGSTVATASWDGWIRLWDVKTGQQKVEQNVGEALRCIEFDPTGQYLAAACAWKTKLNHNLLVWDAQTLQPIRELTTTEDFRLRAVAFSPDGKFLVTGGKSAAVIWDTDSWEIADELGNTPEQIYCLRFTKDGHKLAMTGDGFLQFWDFRNRKRINQVELGSETARQGNFSPDGQAYAYSQGDEVFIHDLAESRPQDQVLTLHGMRMSVADGDFSVDGTKFAAGGVDRTVMVWDMASLAPVQKLYRHNTGVIELEWGNAGRLVSRDVGGLIQVWNADGERHWDHFETPEVKFGEYVPLNIVSVDREKNRLIVGTLESGIVALDMETGEEQLSSFVAKASIKALDCSPDGRWLAFCDNSLGTIEIWDLQKEKPFTRLETAAGHPREICFSPDSKRLAVITTNKVMEFNVLTQERLWDDDSVVQLWSVAYSGDGTRIFVCPGGKDDWLRIYDTVDGTVVYQLHKDAAHIAFDPLNDTLACLSFDGKIQLHETKAPRFDRSEISSPLPLEKLRERSPYSKYMKSRSILFDENAKEYSLALDLVTEAAETIPDCAEYELIRGVALFREGQLDQSISLLNKIGEMDWNVMNLEKVHRDTLETYSHAIRAMAYHQLGKEELARKHLDEAEQLAINQSFKPVLKAVGDAKQLLEAEVVDQ